MESNGKLPPLFIPSKTETLIPEFAVKDLPSDRTATLVPAFAVKDLPLGRTLMMITIRFLRNRALHKHWGRRVIGISGSLIWSETLTELIFPPVVNFGEVRRAQLAHCPHLHVGEPLGSFQIF